MGLIGAAVMYVLVVPVQHWLARRMHATRSASLSRVFAILVIAIPVMWVVSLLAREAPDMRRSIQQANVLDPLGALPRIGRFDVGAELAKTRGMFFQSLSQQALDFVDGAAKATLNLVISFFALDYIRTSAEQSWALFRDFLPSTEDSAEELRDRFYSVTYATVLGTGVNRRWAALLQQIVEVAPLQCRTCHGTMRIVSFITQASVIDQILTHLRTRAAAGARIPRRRRCQPCSPLRACSVRAPCVLRACSVRAPCVLRARLHQHLPASSRAAGARIPR